jgi:hypothetical protein
MTDDLLKIMFGQYAATMADITLHQRAVDAVSKRELEQLSKQVEAIKDNPDLQEISYDAHGMHFYSAIDGQPIQYAGKRRSVEDRAKSVYLNKNRQYQWLLAEAYEAFEDAIEGAYAYSGFKDHGSWPLADYGPITLGELSKQNFPWFKDRAQKKSISSLLAHFRAAFPSIAKIESKNALKNDLRFAIMMIAMFRHIIVHNGGVLKDCDKTIQNIFKDAGIFNNGNLDQSKLDYVEAFLGTGETSNTIHLLEARVPLPIPIDAHVSRLGQLFDFMMGYTHFLFVVLHEKYPADGS